MMRVVMTGATGVVGGHVLPRLRAAGHEVVALSRRPPASKDPGVTWIAADVTTPGPWQRQVDGADAVFHFAGESVAARRWSVAQRARLRASRLDSARLLVAAMTGAARAPGVFVCASAVGYYGSRGEEDLDEQAGAGRGFLAELCVDWEATARRAPVRTICLRFGVVLSLHGGALPRMLPAFKLFVGGPLGRAESWFPWIHEDDAAGLALHALEASVAGPVNAVAPGLVRMGDFARAVGRALSRPAVVPVPEIALRVLLGEMGTSIAPGQKVLPAAAQRTGYRFVHETIDAALAALLSRRDARTV